MEKIIELPSRIDSANANVEGEKINQEISDFDGQIIFDASKLEYISSAGLRVILGVKKKNNSTKIINCSKDVYEIFDMTGFVEMMDIEKSYREVSVDGCEIIGEGANGLVYQIAPDTIVKVYKKLDSISEIKREIDLARKAFVMGIPTAIPYDIVKVGELYGSVFELLNASSFAKLINEGADIDILVKKSVNVLKTIHSSVLKESELPNKKESACKWVKKCSPYLPEEISSKLLELVEAIPDTLNMLHGDYQIKNIMLQQDEVLLIDMDTLSMGHPIFELGIIYAVYEGYSCIDKNNSSNFFGIKNEQCIEICEKTFKYYFEGKSDEYINDIIQKAKIIGYLLIMRRKVGKDDELEIVDYCKNYLIDNVPKIDSLSF